MKAFWNRIPRPLKWAIGIVGIPVALLGIAWIVLYAVASSRLTDALATLRSTGHATSLAELAPPHVPADRNGAPHFLAAFALHPDPEGDDPVLERAFRGELAGGAQLAGRPVSEALVAVDPSQKNPGWLISTRLLAPYWKIIGANYLVQMAHLVDLSRKPYLEARPKIDAWMAELKSKKTPVFEALSLLLIPALSKAMDRQAVNQTALVVVRTGLAWEIERAAAGRYPEALDVIDPLSGKPLLYDKERGRISSAGLPGKTPEQMENDLLVWTLRAPPGK